MTAAVRPGRYRPAPARRAADKILAWLLRKGRGPAFMRLLTVRGRVTGQPHSTPVVPVQRDGRVWLVSPFGDVAWVRNLQAAGQAELGRGAARATYRAQQLDALEAVPVLRDYLSMPSERFVRHAFAVTARSPDEAIAAEAPRHPVFALQRLP